MENKVVCPCPMCHGKDWCNIWDRDNCVAYQEWDKGSKKKEIPEG